MKGRIGFALAFALGLTACPAESPPPATSNAAKLAPEAVPTEADFAEAVGAEITDENFEERLSEIEAGIQSDKSK